MTITTHDIMQAATFLKQGQLVALPTETVYGLGGNALSDHAVAAIYAAKGRPDFNPLIVHVGSLEHAKQYAIFNDIALQLAQQFWPGPLTLVLPRTSNCALSLLVSAGLDTVAIRMPAHPLAQALLKEAQLPIAAPSANRSGRISPTEAAHVQEELDGRIAMILDGGPCSIGIESTVVDVTGDKPVILRPGSILIPEFAGANTHTHQTPQQVRGYKSPGQLVSHYAPEKPLRLNAKNIHSNEGLLAFGPSPLFGASYTENLSERGDLQEAAANLFRMLRRLDASAASAIAVMPIPNEGLGVAINDRLMRAAAPRNV